MFEFSFKNPTEIITLSFCFAGDMLSTDSIVSVALTVKTLTGGDLSPSEILLLTPSLAKPTWVMQRIRGGNPGCRYLITVTATLETGNILVRETVLPIY
jgi:hypothetical protein